MLKADVNILVCGDFFGGTFNKIRTIDFEDFNVHEFSELSKICDLSIVNLESPVFDFIEEAKFDKEQKTGPHLYAPRSAFDLVKKIGFNLVTLSNNHILDYGVRGLRETINGLEEYNIEYVGVIDKKDHEIEFDTFFFEKNNRKIAIINFCENEWSTIENQEYKVNNVDLLRNFNQIKDAKSKAEIVIVIFHGGIEFYKLPSPEMQDFCRLLIEFGANVVICHHTHVYSGFEDYNGGRIFYGLGNFYFENQSFAKINGWNYGYSVLLRLVNGKIHYELIPYYQDTEEGIIRKLYSDELYMFNCALEELNRIIESRDKLEHEYESFLERIRKQYLGYIQPYKNKYLGALFRRGLIPDIWSASKLEILYNLIRCESHKSSLIRVLKNRI